MNSRCVMNQFQIVAIINCPVSKVFSAMDEFEKAPNWNPGVTEVRRVDQGPIKVGSTVIYVGKFLGRSFESCSEYVEYVPNERSATKTVSGPFHLEIENTFEEVEGGTRLTSVFRG